MADAPSPTPILSVRGLTKRFGAVTACEDVDLDLFPGEIHALSGPNGAGKSTLIKQLAGELRPDAGTIRFDGRDIADLSAAERAQAGLARSFQVSAIAPEMTALQNAMLPVIGRTGTALRSFFRPAATETDLTAAALAALERAGLGARADRPAAALSHGERRLLEIALALALEPKAFLLDEPMAGMSADGAKGLTAALDRLRLEAPILLVEHDMDAVFALADRISVLVYGRVIATGRPAEIRANADVREAYLGAAEAPL